MNRLNQIANTAKAAVVDSLRLFVRSLVIEHQMDIEARVERPIDTAA